MKVSPKKSRIPVLVSGENRAITWALSSHGIGLWRGQTDRRTDRGRTSIAERGKDGPRGRKAVVQTWRLRCHAVRCDPRYRLSRQQMFELVNLSSRYKIILLFHVFATQADAGPNSFIDVINLQLFDEMFIFSSKSRCCSGTFTNVIFTSLLKKNI